MAKRQRRTFTCPTCGAEVPEGAVACPECGADDETGWSQDAEYDDAALPDPDEDADVSYESAEQMPARKPWWVIIVILLILLLLMWSL